MYRTLETEGALELSGADAERLVARPFGIEVEQLNRRFTGSPDVGPLYLGAPIEVANLAVEYQAHKPQVKRAALTVVLLVLVLVGCLILQHAIAAQLDVPDPLRQLSGSRLFRCALLPLLLGMGGQNAANEDGSQHP